jgi:pimeloyl-ACP methyl ester carboxylesterase
MSSGAVDATVDTGMLHPRIVGVAMRVIGLVLALVLAGGFPATGAVDPLPIEAFFAKPAVSAPELSPSGRYVAFLRRDGDVSAIAIDDLQTDQVSIIAAQKDPDLTLNWIEWKGEGRLVVGATYLRLKRDGGRPDGEILDFEYHTWMFAMDRDGGNKITLFRSDPGTDARTWSGPRYQDGLIDDPDHILVTALSTRGPAVWKVDVHTGAGAVVEQGREWGDAWITDRDGSIVGRYRPQSRTTLVIEARAPGQSTWSEVARVKRKEFAREASEFEFLGASERPGAQYVAVSPGGGDGQFRNVHVYDFATRTLGPPLWSGLKYDVAAIVRPTHSRAMAGVCFWVDTLSCEFSDKTEEANIKALSRFFHDESNLAPISYSADDKLWIFRVSSPTERAAYYLYDWKTQKLRRLGVGYPGLPASRLGRMERFTYRGNDGAEITGYLTRPPGEQAGPLPLVVIPHGGPQERDTFDFDLLSQVMATRGYLVFQPNFRGSDGYGRSWLEAGYRQWGGIMQQDITDGVNALIASGRVDPKRICIFGASYGGYAALMGGALHPGLYKCVVSLSGVTDLGRFIAYKRLAGSDDPVYEHYLKVLGDPGTDRDRLARDSPTTHAATYGPPVLLIHGEDDTNVPASQSRQMAAALKHAGRDVRLVIVKNEDHTDWDDEHSKSMLRQVTAFISEHIAPAAP